MVGEDAHDPYRVLNDEYQPPQEIDGKIYSVPKGYVLVPASSQRRDPGPKQSGRGPLIIGAAIVIAAVIVVAGIWVVLGQDQPGSGTDFFGLSNGDYVEYTSIVASGTDSYSLVLRMEFSEMSDSSGTITYMFIIEEQDPTEIPMEFEYDPESGMFLFVGAGVDGSADPEEMGTFLGTSSIVTDFGTREVEQYVIDFGDFLYTYWMDPDNGWPLKMQFTYDDGMIMICEISETNIDWLK